MLSDARVKFALECLKKYMMMEPKTNVFLSPHLIYQNLLVVYFGVQDDIENSLRRILHIPDFISKAVVQQYYYLGGANQFCYVTNGPNNSYACRIYSRLLISESKILYVDTMNLFSSGHQVKEMTFDPCPDLARNFINDSIKCVTQRHIQELLLADNIDADTEVVVYNAIYCNGQLDGKFDFDINDRGNTENGLVEQHVSKNKFFNNDKLEQLDAYIIEVPCKEKKLSTFFIFPPHDLESDSNNFTESDKINSLLDRLMTEEGFQELRKLLDDGITQQTNLAFPIFKLKQDLQIYELLEMLGVPELTPSVDTAEMREFTSRGLKLGDVVHSINIDVTKNDITAAAGNAFFTSNSCSHIWEDTILDVLFSCVCLIYDRSQRNILFCGILLAS